MACESLGLEWLLNYELRCSARYGRPMCLAMVAAVSGSVRLKELFRPHLRASDELFEREDRAVILMGETARDGALAAIKRYQESSGSETDLRFALACFPDDGSFSRQLLEVLHGRFDKALTLEFGAVVASD